MKALCLTKETIRSLGITENKFPVFKVGDTIAVTQRIKEGDKERLQVFQGDVLAIHNHGGSSTFIIRKMSDSSVAVERIFPYYSPIIKDIKVIKNGSVRRAKLYYIRKRVGKAARLKEKVVTKEQKMQAAANAQAQD
jgi:large subunit ribosomal protein L19